MSHLTRQLSSLVVVGVSLSLPTMPLRQELPRATYAGFRMYDGFCGTDDDECRQRGPKEWTASELEAIKRNIDEIRDRPGGAAVLARVQKAGGDRIRRYSLGLSAGKPQAGIAATVRRTVNGGGIDLYDRWFAILEFRDAFSGVPGYEISSQVLLHECFHVIDRFSSDRTFMTLAGFISSGSRWRFSATTAEDVALLTQFDRELVSLQSNGDLLGMFRLNRKLALEMRPVRVPSMRSVNGPGEAFAEIGSHLILDPRARTYLQPELVQFFDERVLGARPVAAGK